VRRNVLDQWRIFRLLAKGPRLDSYLAQLKNAEKLDFASWGGFAHNFAGRRIPFENAAYSTYWNRAAGESLHIPTFATGTAGPYLPATAIKGALRTGMVFAHWRDGMLQDALARVKSERTQRVPPRPLRLRASRSTYCARASNLPFPKTRRIVFLNNKPATLPGWAELSVEG
jgi:CRISPR-associated protein Csm5